MGCCGASRAIGMLPQNPVVLGDDDGSAAEYVEVLDGNLIPNVRVGAYRYVKGTGVPMAYAELKIRTIEDARAAVSRTATRYLVHLTNGKTLSFGVQRTAEQYAAQSGGTLEVVTP